MMPMNAGCIPGAALRFWPGSSWIGETAMPRNRACLEGGDLSHVDRVPGAYM